MSKHKGAFQTLSSSIVLVEAGSAEREGDFELLDSGQLLLLRDFFLLLDEWEHKGARNVS
jgi:hypothetical protein